MDTPLGNQMIWQSRLEKIALYILVLSMALPRKFMAIGVIVFVILSIVVFYFNRKSNLPRNRNEQMFTFCFALYFFIHALSLFWSHDLQRGLENLETKIYFILLPATFYFFKIRITNLFHVLYCFVWAVTGIIIVCFSDAFLYMLKYNDSITPFRYYNFVVSVGLHPGFLSMIILLSVVSIGYIFQHAGGKVLLLVLGAFQIFSLVFVGAKFAILALPIVVLFVLLFFYSSRKNIIGIAILVMLLGCVIAFVGFKFSANARERLMRSLESVDIRMGLYSSAYGLILERPIIGYGVGGEQKELLKVYEKRNLKEALYEKYNVHSQYLQSILQTGVIGLGIFILMLISCVRYSENKGLAISMLMVFMFFFTVECVLERQFGTVPFVICMLLCCFSKKLNDIAVV
jgi:O-antigen ligase